MRYALLIAVATAVLAAPATLRAESIQQALQAMSQGDHSRAVAVLKRLAGAQALILKGRAQFLAKQYQQAESTYRQVLGWARAGSSLKEKATLGLAECHAATGKFKQAEQLFSDALTRLSSAERRERIARRYILLGDEHLDPQEGKRNPAPARAERFYRAALEVGITGKLEEECQIKIGRCLASIKNFPEAARHMVRFLEEHEKSERRPQATFLAGSYFHQAQQESSARRYLRDVLMQFPKSSFAPRAAHLISRTYGMPKPKDGVALARGISALDRFVRDFPKDKRVQAARLELATAAQHLGRHAQAVDALEAFIKAGADAKNLATARYNLGVCLAAQGKYAEAARAWREYLGEHPSDMNWLQARTGIEDMAWTQAEAAFKEERWTEAARLFSLFADEYPAAARAPQALYQAAAANHEIKKTKHALDLLKMLTSKFPKHKWAEKGWYLLGQIFEERGDMANVRKTYEQAKKAGHRIADSWLLELDKPSLVVDSPERFFSNQKPYLTWFTRNLEAVNIRLYRIQAEDFFRDRLDMEQVTGVDIALCKPDRTWTVKIDKYLKGKRIQQKVPLPIKKAGLYLVNLTSGDREATTAVKVSDLEMILKSSSGEVFVFAQDLRRTRSFGKTRVMIADSERILHEGTTGGDGVFRAKLSSPNRSGELRAFAVRGDHISWTRFDRTGGQPVTAVSPRAFLFSDRPVYQPGDLVRIAGIVRDQVSKAGTLSYKAGSQYTLSVYDPGGRILSEDPVRLDAFGVFHGKFELDEAAGAGRYAFSIRRPDKTSFSGHFKVEPYRFRPYHLSVDFDRPVVFRGEKLTGTVRVRHHHGSAAADQTLRYRLDDDSVWQMATTDASGEVRFSFPTSGFEETHKTRLTVQLPRHNLEHRSSVLVAVQGYQVDLEVEQETLFAGQPFDLTVKVRGPDDRPRAATLNLEALHLVDRKGETRVFEREISVPESGRLSLPIELPQDGLHVLRVLGHDRARHPITAEIAVNTVGDELPGIYLVPDKSTQTLGTPARVQIHSRLEKALVLLTYETDRILGYRMVVVGKGVNPYELALTEKLVPNFILSAAAMDRDRLYTTTNYLRVTRRLQLTVRADKQRYSPGDQVTLTVIARDADSRPVDARVIVSVVDQALLRIFPENLPDLLETFHHKLPIQAIHTVSSNTFRFPAVTAELVEQAEVHEAEGSAAMAALSAKRKIMTGKAVEKFAEMTSVGGLGGLAGSGVGSGFGYGGLGTRGRGRGGSGIGIRVGSAVVRGGARLRQYFQHTAAFLPEIQTGPDGVATVTFRLPDSITSWRVTARGVTRDTQLGEKSTELVAARPFWVELIVPPELEEGDRLAPTARVFNETGQPLTVSLRLTAAKSTEVRQVKVHPFRPALVPFRELIIPDAGPGKKLAFELQADSKSHADRMRREIPIRPRGIREQVLASGRLTRSVDRTLQLDDGLTDPELDIVLDPRMAYMFVAGRLDPVLFGDRPEEALVALNILDLLGKAPDPAMHDMVRSRLRQALVHLLTVQHHDGGWGWSRKSDDSSTQLTASAVRAISRAHKLSGTLGWSFPQAELDRAVALLMKNLTNLPSEDWMGRAAILHALAHLGKDKVPIVQLHRLHRLRSNMPLGALARLGLSWQLLGRPEKAAEVAKTLRPLIGPNMKATCAFSWLLHWGEEPADLALALALLAQTNPSDPLLKAGADWMLAQGETFGWRFPRQAEAFTFALGKVLQAKTAEQRFTVQITVNGRPAGKVRFQGAKDAAARTVEVNPGLLRQGKNTVKLSLEGAGDCFFSATLSGYRREAPPVAEDAPVRLQRHVEPVPEPYRGHDIRAGFGVVLPGTPRWVNQIDRIPAQRQIEVTLQIESDFPQPLDHCVLIDRTPPGFELVEGSARGNFDHQHKLGRRLAFFLASAGEDLRISYKLQAINPGSYHFPPARLISLANPGTRVAGGGFVFTVLDHSRKMTAEIRPTPDELHQVGMAAAEKQPRLAIEKLEQLTEKHRLREDVAKEVLAKLLFASIDVSDHQRIVKYFELAKERNPSLVIPFGKIGPVQAAYRTVKAYEAGLHLARGLAEARFMAEIRAVGLLESENETAESLALLKQLIQAYPDNPLSAKATYAFSQVIYDRADRITSGETTEGFDRPGLLDEVVGLMASYLGRFPSDPQGPAAVYSLASALLERGRAAEAVAWCGAGLRQHPESDLAPAIAYLKAFTHFKLGQYDSSLQLCRKVIKDSPDEDSREMARYIMAQIHHARGEMSPALALYRKVQYRFRDAFETVVESEKVLLEAPDVIEVANGRRPVLKMTTRNIKTVDLKAYRVDPMKLYLIKGSLRDLEEVNLAGIQPVFSRTQGVKNHVGMTRRQEIPLRLPGKGAYLLLVRGAHRQIHSLVLVGSLICDVSEDLDEGRVRVTVRDNDGRPVAGARVQLKGSEDYRFTVGQTDLRGIFIADQVEGAVTVIASHKGAYGLYRGSEELSAAPEPKPEKVRFKKKTTYEFDDDLVQGQLRTPDPEAQNFFQQDVKGMAVEQAK